MSKRKDSSLLVDTLDKEETDRKKQRVENSRDSYARNINRLALQEQGLIQSVENLKWENKRLTDRTTELKVEIEKEEKKRLSNEIKIKFSNPAPGFDFLHHAFPSPSPSTSSTASTSSPSSSSAPLKDISPLPLSSTYEPFLRDQSIRPPPINPITIRCPNQYNPHHYQSYLITSFNIQTMLTHQMNTNRSHTYRPL